MLWTTILGRSGLAANRLREAVGKAARIAPIQPVQRQIILVAKLHGGAKRQQTLAFFKLIVLRLRQTGAGAKLLLIKIECGPRGG